MFIIPVQAMVRTFGFSIVPHVTSTGGNGAISAPPFHNVLDKNTSPFSEIIFYSNLTFKEQN